MTFDFRLSVELLAFGLSLRVDENLPFRGVYILQCLGNLVFSYIIVIAQQVNYKIWQLINHLDGEVCRK